MPTPTEQLLSRTSYAGDGVTTAWDFAFASGYIDKAHVKAYVTDSDNVRTDLTITEGDFIGPYQLAITPAVVVGSQLTIYRDTPKDAPLVDFADGSNLTEAALDTLAKQAVFCAAESEDALNIVVGPELQATAEQATAAAAAAAVSAASASASALSAASAAAGAAAAAAPALEAAIADDLAAAQAAATSATASAVAAALSEDVVETIASSLPAAFGFNPNGAYDFGFITDPNTYLNLDCGTVP